MRNVAAFGNFKWDILRNGFNESPFFTSDFPVAIEETADWRVHNRVVPLAPNLAVRIRPDLSIDRKHADFSFADFGYRVSDVSHAELVKINQLIVRCAEDTVFYRDDFPWVRKFIKRNRHYRVEMATDKLPTKKGTFVVFRQRIVAS